MTSASTSFNPYSFAHYKIRESNNFLSEFSNSGCFKG